MNHHPPVPPPVEGKPNRFREENGEWYFYSLLGKVNINGMLPNSFMRQDCANAAATYWFDKWCGENSIHDESMAYTNANDWLEWGRA